MKRPSVVKADSHGWADDNPHGMGSHAAQHHLAVNVRSLVTVCWTLLATASFGWLNISRDSVTDFSEGFACAYLPRYGFSA
ncbi:hypothetical protein TNCV_1880601 [Trichonephila clavipes]|nr:hypothetical protein TNCV_1880601 [Trichonephila clavipes]